MRYCRGCGSRYASRDREGRSRMIDELVKQFGYSRKHAIKRLGANAEWGGDPRVRKGRAPVYGADVAEVFWRIWKAAEQPCGKRLTEMQALWQAHYEARYGRLAEPLKKKVLAIRAAQIDRLLAPRKLREWIRVRCGTQPGGSSRPISRFARITGTSPARLSRGRHGGPLRDLAGGRLCLERDLYGPFQRLDGHPPDKQARATKLVLK